MTRTRRRTLAALAAVASLAALFLWLSALVWHHDDAVGLDHAIQRLRASGTVTSVLGGSGTRERAVLRPELALRLGSREVVGTLAVALAGLALLLRDRVAAVVALVGPVTTGILTEYVAKPMINRPDSFGPRSFPSGHAGGIAAVAVVALIIVYRRFGLVAALAFAPFPIASVLTVAEALLLLQYHQPTDALGGIVLAAAVVMGSAAGLSIYSGPGRHLLKSGGRTCTDDRCATPVR